MKLKQEWGKQERDTGGNTLRNTEHLIRKALIIKPKLRIKMKQQENKRYGRQAYQS